MKSMGSNGGSLSVLFALEGGNPTIYEGLSWDLWDHQLSFHPSMCHHGWLFWSFVCNLMDMRKHLCTLLEIIQIATESGFWFCWAPLEQKTQGVWKSNPPHGEDCVGDWWYCTKVPPSRCRERKRLGSNFKLYKSSSDFFFPVSCSHWITWKLPCKPLSLAATVISICCLRVSWSPAFTSYLWSCNTAPTGERYSPCWESWSIFFCEHVNTEIEQMQKEPLQLVHGTDFLVGSSIEPLLYI